MKVDAFPRALHNPTSLLRALKTKKESYWITRGQKRALTLFHQMATHVPAYKDFLKKAHISPSKIKTIDDFTKIPLLDKNNYLRAYPREQLCWGGKLATTSMVYATTSGSTGEPYYFPRQQDQDMHYSLTAELYLRSNFQIHKRTTLYIDGFAMGAWIGGLFTYQAIKHIASQGKYALSIITPGIFKEEIIKAIKNLGPNYDQVIIGGYPPMIKDTIDDGIREGLNWKSYQLGFIFSAEGFSETFRDYIAHKTGLKNVYRDTLNHYGTVDMGTMAHETPLSIYIRRKSLKNQAFYKTIFQDAPTLPTLGQYNPMQFYFESLDNRLICSSFSGIPLVRYDLKDHGGIISFDAMKKLLSNSLSQKLKAAHIDDTIWHLPFVYVYERSDFIVKLYGANIYPDTVKKSLQSKVIYTLTTGKFTMRIKHDAKNNQYLEINIELKNGVKPSDKLSSLLQQTIVSALLKENSEYRSNYTESPQRQIPAIVLWRYEDPTFFRPGVKQKWV
jgi:phenylacetate-CoA ligase